VHLDLEKIMALQPDLCLAIKDGNPIGVVRRLENLGIPLYAVSPRTLEDVSDMLIGLGDVLGAPSQARTIAEDMRRRTKAVEAVVYAARQRPRVFFQIGIAPIVSVGDDTFIHELITLAGGVNLTAGKITYPRLTREEVISLAPDVIVITSMAREQTFENAKAFWQKWKSIPAVKNDRIFLVNSDIVDRPTPRLVEGLEMLAKFLHPRLFEDAP
jgi:iron complex transport system substrate-binding protein